MSTDTYPSARVLVDRPIICSIGDLRLRLPRLIDSYHESFNATTYGHPCLQLSANSLGDFPPDVQQDLEPLLAAASASANVTQSEDCK